MRMGPRAGRKGQIDESILPATCRMGCNQPDHRIDDDHVYTATIAAEPTKIRTLLEYAETIVSYFHPIDRITGIHASPFFLSRTAISEAEIKHSPLIPHDSPQELCRRYVFVSAL